MYASGIKGINHRHLQLQFSKRPIWEHYRVLSYPFSFRYSISTFFAHFGLFSFSASVVFSYSRRYRCYIYSMYRIYPLVVHAPIALHKPYERCYTITAA